MKLHFLGTGAGLPSKYRNTQSMVFNFMQELKECWMFDCGEATQHKIMHTTIRPSKINRIFISHMHGDHVLGLIGFLSSRSFLLNEGKVPLTIYGPKGIKDFIEFNLKIIQANLGYEISYIEYSNADVILDNEQVSVEIIELKHTIQSYGFKIKFKSKKGTLKVDELQSLGIMPGPFYREIKSSDSFIYNGIKYASSDFLSNEQNGKIITLIPDTVYFPELLKFIADADILVSECTYLKETEEKLATNYKHLSIINIYDFAKVKHFDKIYLTHISSRYDRKDMQNIQENLKVANIVIVQDLDEFYL